MNELTSIQLSEWEAYDRLDPIGGWRSDFRIASLISIIVNIARSVWGKEGIKMSVPLDFMPEWDKEIELETKQQTVEEMKQILLSIASRQNKEVERKKRKEKK